MSSRVLAVALACSACASSPTTPPVVEPDVEQPNPKRALLRLYDEAGFPDVSGRRIVERTIEFEGFRKSCNRGVLLDRGPASVFFSVGLEVDYGGLLVDAIPGNFRRSTPRPPPDGVTRRGAREVVFQRQIDRDLPVTALLEPQLGVGPRVQTRECSTNRELPEALDILVRARWAEMRGLPELADTILAELPRGDQAELERFLRTQLAQVLRDQAVRGMLRWLPRMEVAQLLRRAAVVTPSPRLADAWRRQAELLLVSPQLAWGDDPDAIATLVEEQSMRPGYGPTLPTLEVVRASWDVEKHLRDPVSELLALGMPGVERLLARVGDPTWTRAWCGYGGGLDATCTVDDVVRDGLGHFAAREFADADAVRTWWAEVRGMSEGDMLRNAFDGSRFVDAAVRLAAVEGPGVVEEVAGWVDREEPDRVADAASRIFRDHEEAVLSDPSLRARHARVFRDLDARASTWPGAAMEGWLRVDPDAALDRVAEHDASTTDGDLTSDTEDVWGEIFTLALLRRHRGVLAVLVGALRRPSDDGFGVTAWAVVETACFSDPEELELDDPPPPCPKKLRRAAARILRRLPNDGG